MAAGIMDGKLLAQRIRGEIRKEVAVLENKTGKTPGLAVVVVGDDPASKVYVRNKHADCAEVGITSVKVELPADVQEKTLLDKVRELNKDKRIHGLIVQLPLPKHIDAQKVIEAVDPAKDVDGFHPLNMGMVLSSEALLAPSTPCGVMRLLDEYGVDLEGRHAVVVGRSNIVGKPVALMLLKRNATVTVCHSKTSDLSEMTRQADVLVVAVGKPKLIKADDVKKGAVVVDVGTSRVDGKLVGDVDFDAVKQKASFITPVPGGIGPMTRAMLLSNTLKAFRAIENL